MSLTPENSDNQLKAANQDLRLENLASLDIDSNIGSPLLTGIVCTIGPSSTAEDKLLEMLTAGMTIARLNISHGTHREHRETIENIRTAVKRFSNNCDVTEAPIGIAIDTRGPEIRTGLLVDGETGQVELEMGSTVRVTADDNFRNSGTAELIYVDNKEVIKVLNPGNRIYIDNGLISILVRAKKPDYLFCEVENTGQLGSKKPVNFPGVNIKLPIVSEQDVLDLKFAVENNIDIIFASHIENADGVKQIRKVLGEQGKPIKLLAKIENHKAINNIDEIIDASDGIMIARGELGIEIAMEKVFLAQKMIVAKCNKVGKPVVCATQMLESMVWNPRPTRAECSDIANAVLDGVDCIVLTGETARGKYPVDAVSMANSICREAESAFFTKHIYKDLVKLTPSPTPTAMSIAIAVVSASLKSLASAIIVLTSSGQSAHLISRFRPRCPILLVSRHQRTTRQANLYRGLLPIYYDQKPMDDWQKDIDARVWFSFQVGKRRGFLKPKDEVIVVQGWRRGEGSTNCMRIVKVT